MDFSRLKNYKWESLKKTNLGENHKEIFGEVHSILFRVGELILSLEPVYDNLLVPDKAKLNNLYIRFADLLQKVTDFDPLPSEAVSRGVDRAKELLNNIKNFYSESTGTLSELQMFVREGTLKKINTDFVSQKSDVQNILQNKINEIAISTNEQNKKIQEFIESARTNIDSKLNDITQQNTVQHDTVRLFLDNIKSTLDPKIEELSKKLEETNKSIAHVEKVKIEVNKLSETTQELSIAEISSQYGSVFDVEAVGNEKRAGRFGAAFLVTAGIAILIVLLWFVPLVKEFGQGTQKESISTSTAPTTIGGEQNKQTSTGSANLPLKVNEFEYYIFALVIRLTILFIIIWAMREFLKNYNAYSHLHNLNTHRSNSLKSFEIMVRNVKLEENRDEIVKQIAQTIFNHQEDGFISQKREKLSLNEITNLISTIKK